MNRKKILDATVCGACLLFCLAVAWSGGRELSWDQFNYHLYGPHAYLHGLHGKDFMAANLAGYLNPLPHIPFYLMVQAGWPSLGIGMALAAFHALGLIFLWLICRTLFGVVEEGRARWRLSLLGLALGAASPVFMAELGTSFADITTTVFVMAGVALLLLGVNEPEKLYRYTFWGGLCLGAAVWLKLSNAPFAVAACVFAWLPGLTLARRVGYLLRLAAGGIVGGLIVTGHWCWVLYREFGNPLFPMFSGYSRPAEGYSASALHLRFMPDSLIETLALPFRMLLPQSYIYTEMKMPDVRFAVFFLLLGLAGLMKLWERLRHRPSASGLTAAQILFLAYALICWAIWAVFFVNGRYFLPLTLLVGPATVILLTRIFSPARLIKWATFCVAALLFAQGVQWHYSADHRFGEAWYGWPAAWLEMDIPAKLSQEPHLSLSLDILSNSFLATYYHPDSRFANVNGMLALDLDHPGKERLERLLTEYHNRTRVIFNDRFPVGMPEELRRKVFDIIDADMNRFGLRVDRADCAIINILSRPRRVIKITRESMSSQTRQQPVEEVGYARIFSCGVTHVPVSAAIEADRKRATAVLDVVERTCPKIFPPTHAVVQRNGLDWARFYNGADLWLRVNDDGMVRVGHHRLRQVDIGKRDEIAQGRQQVDCSLIRWR